MKGVKHVLVAQHFAKSQTVEITLNKAVFNEPGISFSDAPNLFPVVLSDDVSGIKATVDFDEELGENGEFVFDINGEPFENHLFLDSSFCLEDVETKAVCAKVSVNEKVVSEGGKEWHPVWMQQAIWA